MEVRKTEFTQLHAYQIINLINLRKIFISSDHAGFKLKEAIKIYLSKKKLTFQDLGPHSDDRVDYPDYAHKVARRVKISKNNIGILVMVDREGKFIDGLGPWSARFVKNYKDAADYKDIDVETKKANLNVSSLYDGLLYQ